MTFKTRSLMAAALLLSILCAACQKASSREQPRARKSILASDTILSGMGAALLPPEHFEVSSILPPGQCPGHYDVKLSDIAKVKRADLVVSFTGMPFMQHVEVDTERMLFLDTHGRNWMAPDSYIAGLDLLAEKLSERFPEYRLQIAAQRDRAAGEVVATNRNLSERIRRARVSQRPVIASSMLREPLEWMGLRVVGEYGRPESLSAKEIAELIRVGRKTKAAIIVDNLQSGPEAGKGIAEALQAPHVVLSNFPLEKGYAATLGENVDRVLAALRSE